MKKMLIAFSALTLVFTACKKDKDDVPADVTPTQQNLVGTYTLAKITISTNGSAEQDVTAQMTEACERDDQQKLNADLTYNYVDAGTVCSPSGSYSGDWSLINSTTIEIDGYPMTIRRFNGQTIELTESFMGSTYITYMNKQ